MVRHLNHLRIAFSITCGIACVLLVVWIADVVDKGMVIGHQISVTQELAAWEQEYGSISSNKDATRTAEMLEYVQHYYVVGDGYRSAPEVEAVLESQRRQTTDAFVRALRNYTGEDFGTDSDKWRAYLNRPADRPSSP